MANEIVLPEDDKAAELVTIKMWKSRSGGYYHESDERIARWAGATHVHCKDCGVTIKKGAYTACNECREKRMRERYASFEKRKWEEGTPVCTFDDDRYFWSMDEVEEHCYEFDCTPDDLMLVHCKPQHPWHLEPSEIYDDIMPEDNEVSADIEAAFDTLNSALSKCGEVSWAPTNVAVELEEDDG